MFANFGDNVKFQELLNPPNRRRDHLPHDRDGKCLFSHYSTVYKVLLVASLQADADRLLEFDVIYPTVFGQS